MSIIITLEDCPQSITDQAKQNAEYRFQRVLERQLGESDIIIQTYKAWQNAMEVDESELSKTDKSLALQWIAAATKAQLEGLKELGECEAYFDIRINR